MIRFDGVESFPHPPAELAPKLSDAAFLVGCIPDAEGVTAAADRAAWKLRPKLAFMSGALEVTLDVVSRAESAAAFRVFSKAVGATSTVNATLDVRPADGGGSAVHWAGEMAEVTGLLKMVPKGLMQATAQKVIADVWAAVRAKLNSGAV